MNKNVLDHLSKKSKELIQLQAHEKINGHCELTVTTVVTALGPNDHGSVTARRGHSSITASSV